VWWFENTKRLYYLYDREMETIYAIGDVTVASLEKDRENSYEYYASYA
jgi:hypothetical protein